ncbi:MAG: hypothetical protein J0I34_07175 [Pseudonocardia sp.]|uniref:hypothetical protein n=2 Tax=Actinomycetota TaxID=201174 RepID=UPI00086BC60F|nr:hypothetical protein [Pseudonocardia sp.]MBN9108548.1 hypothetical protein [Pseudonocardia sp.]ODU27428.1 MAG: hypothetical protein ABS80_03365 [Pseudonocardia sp. SCN 72-51]ODV07810.1 MAG: hypothetical protein ABT15_06955 [Pseudonocardia sp. SCN 73-27]
MRRPDVGVRRLTMTRRSPARLADPAEAEEAAWQAVLVAQERLHRALVEHRRAAEELFRESAARAVEDAELVRNFRALLPYATRRTRIPPPRRPQD